MYFSFTHCCTVCCKNSASSSSNQDSGEEQRWLQLLPFLSSSLNSKLFVSFWLVLSILGRAAVFRTTVLRYSLYQHLSCYLLTGFCFFFYNGFSNGLSDIPTVVSFKTKQAWEMGFSTSYIMCLGFMQDERFDSWENNLGRLLMNLF